MALSHIVLHVALCNSALRLKAQTELPLHVVVTDKINRDVVDQNFRVVRENGNDVNVAVDVPWGLYHAKFTMRYARVSCAADQWFTVLADHNRTLNVSLQEGPLKRQMQAMVMGSVPFAFSYVQPTVVAFDKSVACNGPVGDPLDAGIITQNDNDGYYADIFPNTTLLQHSPPVIAVRMTDSHGGYHYIRIPAKFSRYAAEGGASMKMDVNEDVIDYVADKPEDTLLCPHEYVTEVQ
jgi:hypothetical protein